MTEMTPGLAEFVSARLDEDQAAAEAATPGPWAAGGLPGLPCDFVHAPGYRPEGFSQGQHVADASVADGGMGPWAADVRGSGFPRANAEFIARHDPARVLRDVARDRAILALHRAEPGQHPGFCWHDKHELPCPTQRWLATSWRDHPDYQPEWAP